jgi:hypothetical protein
VTCKEREFLATDGRCYPCQPYTIPDLSNDSRDQCIAPSCPDHAVITPDGLCKACDAGMNPDYSRRNCVKLVCGFREIIKTEDNVTKCEQCPIRTRAQDQNTRCGPDPCNLNAREYLLEDGTCYKCGNYLILNETKDRCVAPSCETN